MSKGQLNRFLNTRNLLIIGIVTVIALGGGFLSLTDVEAQQRLGFQTDSENSEILNGDGISNGMTLYGEKIYINNLEKSIDSEEIIAYANWGDERKPVYTDTDKVSFENGVIEIQDLHDSRCYEVGFSSECRSDGNINNIVYYVDISIDKSQITTSFDQVNIEDVGPGKKKVEANLTVNNDFGEIEVDRLYATVFGTSVDLDSGNLEKGENSYSITASESFYDSSQFIFSEEVDGEIQLNFENPRIPQSRVSGKPNQDGDWRTWESFDPGGAEPQYGGDFEGGSIDAADGACNIQYINDLESRGYFGGCYGVSGGETFPKNTKNHKLKLQDFQSVVSNFTTQVNYCGENAVYEDGECVVDEDLHLRGDLCLLLENYTMVTEEFGTGTYNTEDLQYDPGYFCSKHAVVIADEGAETGTTISPYQSMVNGESFTVPKGSTYQLSYAVDSQSAGIDVVCGEDTVLNESTGQCTVDPGFTHVCGGDSTWNPDTGSCTTHTEVEPVCNGENERYDSSIDKCVSEAPSTGCPVGSVAGPEGDVCYSEASVKRVCPDNIKDGRVTDQSCVSDAEVVLRQRNLVGDLVNLLENTWTALLDLLPM